MRPTSIVAIVVAAALAPVAIAQDKKNVDVSGAVATAPGQAKAVALVTATGTIDSIDAATRTIKIKLPSGALREVEVGDEVRNFDQLKVGDKVKAKYVESLTIELKKDGKQVVGRTESTSLDRAQPGMKPGGVAKHEVTVVADVVNVDPKKHLVQVKNEHGETVDLNVKDPEQLKLVKKGDQVQATYTVALAVAVEPAGAPAKK
ncbi:MAG TPA: hypothetical protein VFJ62_12430 [Usitatibacter sp.]|nr:hypothetical protein [Usitatibacter sp.]